MTVITNKVLYDAMGKMQPPIEAKKADKTEVLIQNIVDSMRTREVAPSPAGVVLQGSVVKQEPSDDASVVHTQKKQRADELDAVTIADATEGLSADSSTPAKLAADAAIPAGAHAKQPASAGNSGAIDLQHQPQSRTSDVMEGPSRSSDSPVNHATANGVLEVETAREWGRLEFGNGTVVALNIAVGARYVIGHTQAKGLDSACDFEAVDSWKNSNGLVVISSFCLIAHMIYCCY